MPRMVERVCEHCRSRFMAEAKNVRRGRQRFCSRSCSGAATLPHPDQSGPNNRNWRGGVSTYRRDYADQARAHDAVRRAIKRGELTRQACERCASTDRVEAHHDDYGKPLDRPVAVRPVPQTGAPRSAGRSG